MRILVLITLSVFFSGQGFSQDIISKTSIDSFPAAKNYRINKQRLNIVIAGNIIAYGGTMVALYNSWYKDYPQSNFHFFNDNKEWLQVDKVGHAYSAYTEGRASMEMWKWTGMSRNKRIWIGGLSGTLYQSAIEVLDGFSSEWGFSWGDYTANIIGSGMLIGQEFAWDEQRVSYKFSFHRNTYGNPVLNERADEIYGKSLPSRMLKDYNAQSYWLSVNLKSFLKDSNLPDWFNLAIGYGAEGMFGAIDNKWVDKNGHYYNLTNIKRYRQFYFSPDIDFTRIKTKNKFLKTTFFVLNSFKFPAPSIELSNKHIRYHWIHF